MIKKGYFTCFFLLLKLFLASQTHGTFSVFIAEQDPLSSKNNLQHLLKYRFSGGKLINKDTIVTVKAIKPDVKGNYVRFDYGKNKLYKNKYIITGLGNIIDIETKQVIYDGKGKVVKYSGDSIIYYTNDIFKGKYYSYFNLGTLKHSKIEKLTYKAIVGKNIEVDNTQSPFKIWLYHASEKKELLIENAGDAEIKTNNYHAIPIFWIDEDCFLFAKYQKSEKQLEIIKASVNTKSILAIGSIESIKDINFQSFFYLDEENKIIFTCSNGKVIINTTENTLTQLNKEALGANFYIKNTEMEGKKMLYDGDKEIGNLICDNDKTTTSTNILAIKTDIFLFGNKYAEGVNIWDRKSKTWIKLEIPEIIGFGAVIEE